MSLDFGTAYKKLNTSQKAAVDNIEGPVLVIAGPGTGKTQLLGLRVANILDKTDSLPENILCLTFTDSAVSEMRSRLSDIIGQEAYNVTVSTYHSFGSDMIRYYPAYFGNYTNLLPLSKLAADSILRDIQTKLPYSNPYKSDLFLSDLKQLISNAKQALLSPEDIKKIAESNLVFIKSMSEITKPLSDGLARVSKSSIANFAQILKLPTASKSGLPTSVEPLDEVWNRELEAAIEQSHASGKTASLSAWKLKFMAKDGSNNFIAAGSEQNDRLIDFAKIYQLYIDNLATQNLYDFDDMILRSIEVLESNPDLRYTLQEKYLYILLDEFQDTNQAQAKLVALLSDNPVNEGRPNVMAVGDDDQAIYAFQGAKYSHMLDFASSYTDVKLITLKENYRSSSDIIDLSSKVAGQIESRLPNYLKGINKKFVVGDQAQEKGSNIVRLNFSSETDQYAWIAENIKAATKKGEPLSQIAILAPQHKYLISMVPYLQGRDIPISYERRENILEDVIIDQLVNICRLIKSINDGNGRLTDSLLSTTLGYEFWGLPTEKVWNISWQAYSDRQPWLKIILGSPETRPIGLFLLKLANNAKSLSFDYLLDQIIGLSELNLVDKKSMPYTSPFYSFYSSKESGSDVIISEIFSSLVTLREQFADFRVGNFKPLQLNDFVDFIDELILSDMKLINSSPYSESADSVQLMTAYAAKGQEFKTVYVLSAIDNVWGQSARSRPSRIGLPPNLKYIRYRDAGSDERLRLLYVAITRAKSVVYITSYTQNLLGKPTIALKYLDESSQAGKTISPYLPKKSQLVKNQSVVSNNSVNLISSWRLGYKPLELKTDLVNLLKPRLENYQLSPTELNSFLDIRYGGPANFYTRYVLKYPSPVNAIVDYGTAVHESLDWLQKQITKGPKVPVLRQLSEQFEIRLKTKRLSEIEYSNLLERGRHTLSVYYEANKQLFNKDALSECNFKNEAVFIGEAHLNGNIDKLIIDKPARTVVVADYKTGKSYARWASEPKLHIYANQLYFYKILVERSNTYKNYRVSSAYLDFVEPDNEGRLNKLVVDFDDAKMKRFEKLIGAVWQHILNLDFPDTSTYSPDLKGINAFEDDLISGQI